MLRECIFETTVVGVCPNNALPRFIRFMNYYDKTNFLCQFFRLLYLKLFLIVYYDFLCFILKSFVVPIVLYISYARLKLSDSASFQTTEESK